MIEFLSTLQPALPLISVLIGSLIAFLTTRYFTKKTDDRAVRHTAAQLAQYLDVFANECANVISENDMHTTTCGHAGILSFAIPNLSTIPKEVDLQMVEAGALSRLLSLRLKRELASRTLQFNYSMEGGPDISPEETNHQCGILGVEAVEIAAAIRQGAKLPNPDYGKYHYDFSTMLHKQKNLALSTRFQDLKNSK